MWFKAELDPNIQFFLSSMICLGLFTAARVCEQVRAAIQSLPRGQKNAALAMGLTLPQAYRYVLLPNAYRVIVPPMTSEMMNPVKNSAIASTIGFGGYGGAGRQTVGLLGARLGNPSPPLRWPMC